MRVGPKRTTRPTRDLSRTWPRSTVRKLTVIGLALLALAPAAAAPASTKAARSTLLPGASLAGGSWLESRNGSYKLVMQRDGNLVLYSLHAKRTAVWASNTVSHTGAVATMQRDGNFVIHQGHHPIWASGSDRPGDGHSTLVVQNAGSVVIYNRGHNVIWQTGTLPPLPLRPFASPRAPGEGIWHAAGRRVAGQAVIYETLLRPPGSSVEAGVAWIDTRLLRAALYSGSVSPGPGPWKLTAPIKAAAARTLVAAFNGGFKFPATEGGYYSEGRLVYPLRVGGASFVIYSNGDATVGQWGRDVQMTRHVIAVRQNLTLLVDHGRPVPGLNPYDRSVWGSPLGGIPNVWRSGIGVTPNGALVYISGPSLEITQLAALLVRAGCVRAMTLDMNRDWTVLATYDPRTPTGLATPTNGRDLVAGMVQGPYTFFESGWARDFITMSAR